MTMPLSIKAQHEKELVTEFLSFMHLEFKNVRALEEQNAETSSQRPAGPDVFAQVRIDDGWREVGLELTRYQVVRTEKGSVERLIHSNWEKHIRPLLPESLCGLSLDCSFEVRVEFCRTSPPKEQDAEQIARELEAFLRKHAPVLTGPTTFGRPVRRDIGPDFQGFPFLEDHVETLRLYPIASTAPDVTWRLGGALCIGIDEERLLAIIEEKKSKSDGYATDEIEELWLLIAATGETLADRGGPPIMGRDLERSASIQKAADESAFAQVVFWERARRWRASWRRCSPSRSSDGHPIA